MKYLVLHLEIIEERLDREFDLSLITTSPSVIYKVYKTDGEIVELYNPSDLPVPNDYLEIKFSKSEIYENERNLSIIPHGNRFNYLDFNKL